MSEEPSAGKDLPAGPGSWPPCAVQIVADKKNHVPFSSEQNPTFQSPLAGRKHGMIFRGMGNALEFAPPLTTTRKEVEEGLKAIDQSLDDVEKKLGYY
jgi:adenosylmethionine-8-amino-7-oxononanoate aminotransferase